MEAQTSIQANFRLARFGGGAATHKINVALAGIRSGKPLEAELD
jgi:hypothetical protein